MNTHLSDDDNLMDFLIDDEPLPEEPRKKPYKVLIVDDESEMHSTTRMVLKNFRFEERGLEILDAYNAEEAKALLREHPDLALIMLDVVMEESDSGLKVVQYIRNTLKNKRIRIILRTGQPGEAPEEKVITDYDINDYRLKTELTVQRLFTSLYEALRSYRDISALEHSRAGLEKIIAVSSELLVQDSTVAFYNCILEQMMFFQDDDTILYFREMPNKNGLVFSHSENYGTVIAATGRFKDYLGEPICNLKELGPVYEKAMEIQDIPGDDVITLDQGYLVYKTLHDKSKSFIFIEGRGFHYDLDLIRTFLSHYSMALDNYLLNQEMIRTQSEIIHLLSEHISANRHSPATHRDRVTEIATLIAEKTHLSDELVPVLKVASILHNTDSSNIANTTLLKPGRFTAEEFTQMRRHTLIESSFFNYSCLQVVKWAREICRCEEYAVSKESYPRKLNEEGIPLTAQIVALSDYIDILTHDSGSGKGIPLSTLAETLERFRDTCFESSLIDAVRSSMPQIESIINS